MKSLQETQKQAELLFRLLFTVPGEAGKLTTAAPPFLRQLKGLIDAFTGRGGEAVCADYFNEIYRRIIAVGGANDARRGEKLLLFYSDEDLVNPGALVKQLREKKLPNLWNFIKVDALPMLGSGKLDYTVLQH